MQEIINTTLAEKLLGIAKIDETFEFENELDKATFEVPYDLFKTILLRGGQPLKFKEWMRIKKHPGENSHINPARIMYLFSIWMSDNGIGLDTSDIQHVEYPRKPMKRDSRDNSRRKFRRRC